MFVESFMAWSATANVDERVEAIVALSQTYLGDEIFPEDRPPTEKAFTLYLADQSSKVRAAMAAELAKCAYLPRALVWGMAQDIPEVAIHIYEKSPVLGDHDLCHAVSQCDETIQALIAGRDGLTGPVVRAIVAHAGEEAVLALLHNPSVVIGPGLKHDIATRLGQSVDIRAYLLNEGDLKAATRQMLVAQLSNSLVAFSAGKGWADQGRVKEALSDAANRATIEIAVRSNNEAMGEYVEHLAKSRQLTPALLIRAICSGNAALFEAAIAFLSGASLSRVQSIVDEGRVSAFRSLFNKTKLPEAVYPVFSAAISAWQQHDNAGDVLTAVTTELEHNPSINGALFALLGRMSAELTRAAAQNYQRQPQLTAA